MKNLQIRDLPDWVYALLKFKAHEERRTLAQQAIICLELGLNLKPDHKERRKKLLKQIMSQKPSLFFKKDSEALIREDRDR